MCAQSSGLPYPTKSEEAQVKQLYLQVIEGWNERDAKKMSAAFAEDGFVIGFDGTRHSGAKHIQDSIGRIFQDHVTPRYVSKVKNIRLLAPDVAQLEAIVGMIPNQKKTLDPKPTLFKS